MAPGGSRRRGPISSHDDDRSNLHQGPPGLCRAALRCAGDLAFARFASELPEELGDLHEARRSDGVADAQQAAGRAAGKVAVSVEDTVPGRLWRLALVEQHQALQVVELLVVERVVGLR